jgi:hypothetical protein
MDGDRISARVLASGLLLSGMGISIALAYGFQYRADADNPLSYFLPISGVFFLCLILIVASFATPAAAALTIGVKLHRAAGLAMMAIALSLTLFFHGAELPFPALLAIGVLLVGATASIVFGASGVATIVVVAVGLAVQIFLALTNPLDVQAANMLPIIGAGCELLLQLKNPYLATFPGIASEPLYYLPGLILPYCTSVAVGLDMRIVNVALILAIVAYASLIFDLWRHPERLSLGLLPLLLLPQTTQMMIHGHVWLYWLLVVAFVHALSTGRLVAAALLLGLLLATRQMALFLAIPAAVYMAGQLRPAALLRYAAITLSTYVVVMAPVMVTMPGWVDHFYLGLSGVGIRLHLSYGNPMNQVSLSGLLTDTGLAGLLRPLQAATILLVAVVLWVWRRRLAFDQVVVLLGVGYVIAIGFNGFLHRYFYMPGLILIALGIAYAAAGPLTAPAHGRGRNA